MDGNGNMNLRNWGAFNIHPPIPPPPPPTTTTVKSPIGLQLSINESGSSNDFDHHHHHHHPMASTNGGPFHHHRVGGGGISAPRIGMDYWNDYYHHNHPHGYYHHQQQVNYGMSLSPEASSAHLIDIPKIENVVPEVEENHDERDDGGVVVGKKRGGGRIPKSPPKEKKPRIKAPRTPKDVSTSPGHRSRAPKKRAEVVINGKSMDISELPTPYCSCTGNAQSCYKWGCGGWQSACCTTGLSMYPLPMSTKRRGARVAGRKMSIGAFTKVLEKLSSDGYDFSNPIDLRNYWAKHGTNKFVTIR